MYAFIDQPVERLCNGGRFVLWAMRGWTGAMAGGACPQDMLAKGFAGVGAASALPHFHTAMLLIDRHCQHALIPAPMGCCTVGESEAILIRLWRDVARGDLGATCGTLALLMPETRTAPIVESMIAAARTLAAAGFDLAELSHRTLKEEK